MGAGLRGARASSTSVSPDGMRIRGPRRRAGFGGGEIDSRGDHRIAMAFAVAEPARGRSPIEMRDMANVATSFPGFVALARAVGLDVVESESGA